MNSIPLISNVPNINFSMNRGNASPEMQMRQEINTSLVALKREAGTLEGLINEASQILDEVNNRIATLENDTVKKSDIVDVVQSGNMNPVTSNAVANLTSTKFNTSKNDANLCYADSTRVEFFRLSVGCANCPPSNDINPTVIQASTYNDGSYLQVTQMAYDNYSGVASYIRSGYGTVNNITWSSWNKITIDTELNTVVGGHFFRLPSPIGNVRYAKIKIKNYNKSADSVFIAFNCYSMWGVIRENHQCFYRGTLYGIQGISYTPYSSDNDDFFWVKWANYRIVEFVSSKELELVELTATAPSGITFTAPVQWT